jgi:hypothetical protein
LASYTYTFCFPAFVSIGLVWLLGDVFNVLNDVLTAYIEDGACKLYVFNTLTAMQASGTIGFCLNYFIPIFILIYCYSMMAYSLRSKVSEK